MKLTDKQLDLLSTMMYDKITTELKEANDCGRIECYLKQHKYESIIKNECSCCFVKPDHKILVIGDIRFDKSQIKRVAEEYAIDPDQIDVIDKYKGVTRFEFDNLINSTTYSDIIVGAIPHKTKGTNGASGIIAHILNNKDQYPNTIIATAGGNIKLTLNTFTKALLNTKYYAFLCL